MFRIALLSLVIVGCGSSKAQEQDPPTKAPEGTQRIAVPGGQGANTGGAGGPTAGGPSNPKMMLQPDEGKLDITPATGAAGTELTATLTITASAAFHMSPDYPISLALDAPAGVKLAKASLDKADMQLAEKSLAAPVKATAEKAGEYDIQGVFKFGVCDDKTCHPKKQPVAIHVAAK